MSGVIALRRGRELAVPLKDPSAGRSASPCVVSLALFLARVIVVSSRFQVGMNARRETL